MDSLIEGLPDAVALQCIARVPLTSHLYMRAVNRAWRFALCSRELFELRESLGTSEEWLYVSARDPDRIWQAFNPSCERWYTLPALPTTVKGLFNFGTAALEGKLYVIGGGSDDVDPVTGDRSGTVATNEVWVFDPVRGMWCQKAPMIIPRARFACCVLDGCIVVAGGFTTTRRYVATAEIYNPAIDKWAPIADLCQTMSSSCSSVVVDGKVYVVHKDVPSTQVYDPIENKWQVVDCFLLQGPMGAVNGDLCVFLNSIVSREHQEESMRRTIFSWPSWYRRQGFGVAGLGGDLYVVGGVTFPRPGDCNLEQLNEAWICRVDGEGPVWRRGASMTLLKGSISGCIALRL